MVQLQQFTTASSSHSYLLEKFSSFSFFEIGLELAKLSKLPTDVLEKARVISDLLESLAENGRQRAEGTRVTLRRKVLLQVGSSLLLTCLVY